MINKLSSNNKTIFVSLYPLQQLVADMIAYNTDLALISETWFKSHHNDAMLAIPGYNLFQRDRARRRGGGVAIYVKSNLLASVYIPCNDDSIYEVLWIKLQNQGCTSFIGALYHPPKPLYRTDDFLEYLHRTVEQLIDEPGDSVIILGGDFNQIPHFAISALGLQIEFSGPTHLRHPLDRIYSSIHLYNSCRAFQSAVRTGHMAIVASDAALNLPINKKKSVCTFRRRTPTQHAALLAELKTIDWKSVISTNDIEYAFCQFYEIMNNLLNKYYPLKSITISDKDPYFITPEIKCLLRLKNKMMRSGRLQCADSLSRRIGERITRCNANYFSYKNLTSRELWGNVRKLMGEELSGEGQDSTFTATMLNDHYAKISTDPHYACPRLKCTASNGDYCVCWVTSLDSQATSETDQCSGMLCGRSRVL